MKTYLLDKKYLCKMIEELPDVVGVDGEDFMYYVDRIGESVEVGKMGKVREFSLFCPPRAAMLIMEVGSVFQNIVDQAKRNFSNYQVVVDMIEELGQEVELHFVGQNSSHEFWLGLMDGKIVKVTCGESWDGDKLTTKRKIFVNLDNPGYIGHW